MAHRTSFPAHWLFFGGVLLSSCASLGGPGTDPYFAGYHAGAEGDGITSAITDREALLEAASSESPPAYESTEPPPPPASEEYTSRNWYRDRYYDDPGFRFSLSYHLNGPYQYRNFRSRAWPYHHQRWGQRPWHGGWPYYGDYGWTDPWYGYGYYNPWDPWYYDPYWAYGYGGYPYGGYGYYGHGRHSWHSGYGASTGVTAKASVRRPHNRRDLPTGPGSWGAPNADASGAMTTVVTTQPGSSASRGGTAKGRSKGKATGGTRARGANRKTSAAERGKERSSSGSASRSSSSGKSKSSGKSGSRGKTSRPRNRKP